MLMQEPMRDSRDPGAPAACRGESSSLLKILRRERRAAAAIEEARYSYGRRYAGDSIHDYQRQVSRLGACITNLEGMGLQSSVAGHDWVARAALHASSPSDRVDATTAAAIRAVKDAATSARPLVTDAQTMAPSTTLAPAAGSETVAVTEAARHKTQAMRDEATAMAAAAAAAAAAEAMAGAGSRVGQAEQVEQAGQAGWAERRPLQGASMAHARREARAAAATELTEETLRQAHTLHTPCT